MASQSLYLKPTAPKRDLLVIALLKDPQNNLLGYRLFSENQPFPEGNFYVDLTTEYAYSTLEQNNALNVVLAPSFTIEKKDYPLTHLSSIVVGNNITETPLTESLIILARVLRGSKTYYKIVNYSGEVAIVPKSYLLTYVGRGGILANARVISKEGSKYIRSRGGKFPVIVQKIENTYTEEEFKKVFESLEDFLKKHHEEIDRKSDLYGADIRKLLKNQEVSVRDLVKSMGDKPTPEVSKNSPYQLNKNIVLRVMGDVAHVKIVKRNVRNRIKKSREEKDRKIQSLLNSFAGIATILGGVLTDKPLGKAVSVLCGSSIILNEPRIRRYLTDRTWDLYDKCASYGEFYIVDYTVDHYYYHQRKRPCKNPAFFYLNRVTYNPKYHDGIKEVLENAYIGAMRFMHNPKNFEVFGYDASNQARVIKYKRIYNGVFLKLLKAGLLAQNMQEADCDTLVKKLIKDLKQWDNIDPDLKVDPSIRDIKLG